MPRLRRVLVPVSLLAVLYIDPLMRQGIGVMGGTRATAVAGTLANGQIVPYPAPAPGVP